MNERIYAVTCAVCVFGLTIPVYGAHPSVDFDQMSFNMTEIIEQLGDETNVLPVPYPAETDYDPATEVIKRSLAGPGLTNDSEYEFSVQSVITLPPQSKEEFCSQINNLVYFKRLILWKGNMLAFSNRGGVGGGGVCWWHSLLTQRAVYLSVFRPDLPKPTKKQVLRIFDAYFWNNRVVEIPGYVNFREFSYEWRTLLQKKLEDWQIVDGIIGFQWINGLTGASRISPEKLKKKMDKLFNEVRIKNKIVYQKLQMPGIPVHAWLVVDMKKTSDGYLLAVLDSNHPRWAYAVQYKIGDCYLKAPFLNTFVPYTQHHLNDWKKMQSAQKRYCSTKEKR